jgi:hypothetical protein
MGHFRYPDAATDRPCWTCEHVAGEIAGGLHALCVEGGRKYVQALPARGCVYWLRATGSDDEPGTSDAPRQTGGSHDR